MNKTDINKVILENKLIPFILGEGEFSTIRPEVDYSRWQKLVRYYNELDVSSPLRLKIETAVIDLFGQNDEIAKYASISLGRSMKIPAIANRISQLIITGELDQFSKNLRNEILFSAIKLQLQEPAVIVVSIFMSEDRLDEFILCSATPPYIEEVGSDDLWRLGILHEVFEKSNTNTRELISSNIHRLAGYSRNFALTAESYLLSNPGLGEFGRVLSETLASLK